MLKSANLPENQVMQPDFATQIEILNMNAVSRSQFILENKNTVCAFQITCKPLSLDIQFQANPLDVVDTAFSYGRALVVC